MSRITLLVMIPSQPDSGSSAQRRPDAVLLVEDEQPLLEVYVAALGPRYEVATALDVAQAERLLSERNFKVVLADHLMPGGNGLDLLIRARGLYPHLQRVLITGYLKPELVLRSATEAAVFRLVQKPVRIAELLTVVAEAVRAHDASVAACK